MTTETSSGSAPDNPAPVSVVTALYLSTRTLHTQAEKTGIIREMLRGAACRDGYILLMRNLLPAYRALEDGLGRHRNSSELGPLAAYRLDRTPAIESDLAALCGRGWAESIPLLDEGQAYADRVAEIAEGDGIRLIAHAYTRYLGDLSGGQILKRLLGRSLHLADTELSFYDFPHFPDLATLKSDYRVALDTAGAKISDPAAVIAEGALAFSLNIAVSCAVQTRIARDGAESAHAAE